MVDSHWVCQINDANYKKYKETMPKIYFLLVDDEGLKSNMLARFTIWSITPSNNKKWQTKYVENYYENYCKKKVRGEKISPMNVHPNSPKFTRLEPSQLFKATISDTGNVKILLFPQ
jgi:hypothetical protein